MILLDKERNKEQSLLSRLQDGHLSRQIPDIVFEASRFRCF